MAEVQGRPIFLHDLQERLGKPTIFTSTPAEDTEEPQRILEDFINLALMRDEMLTRGFDPISDEEVDQHIESLLQRHHATLSDLERHLKSEGQSMAHYREDLGYRLEVQRFHARVIAPQIVTTKRDLETFYLSRLSHPQDALEYTLRFIRLKTPDPRDLEHDLSMLSFSDVEKRWSSRAFTGSMKILLKDAQPWLKEPLSKTALHTSTPILDSPLGPIVFFVEHQTLTDSQAFESQRKALTEEWQVLQGKKLLREWVLQQRQKAKIRILHTPKKESFEMGFDRHKSHKSKTK
jgi:hypothetical protein